MITYYLDKFGTQASEPKIEIPRFLNSRGIDGELNKNRILERFSKLWDFKIYYFK